MTPSPDSFTEAISAKATKLMRAKLERECVRRGISLSAAVREALEGWLKRAPPAD